MSFSFYKNKLTHNAYRLGVFFINLIFPVDCLGCGKEGEWLCSECFLRLKLKEKQYCLGCKKENLFGEFCRNCSPNYFLDGVMIAGDYDNKLIERLITNFKYRFVKDIGIILGKVLVKFFSGLREAYVLNKKEKIIFFENLEDVLIMPVPLHKKRLRWRGYNQAEIIAREFALQSKKHPSPQPSSTADKSPDLGEGEIFLLSSAGEGQGEVDQPSHPPRRPAAAHPSQGGEFRLMRVKNNKPQAKLGEKERQENIKDCFAWRGEDLAGRCVILIDDVTTTGATLNECARILKANGAGKVWGLVVAKG